MPEPRRESDMDDRVSRRLGKGMSFRKGQRGLSVHSFSEKIHIAHTGHKHQFILDHFFQFAFVIQCCYIVSFAEYVARFFV